MPTGLIEGITVSKNANQLSSRGGAMTIEKPLAPLFVGAVRITAAAKISLDRNRNSNSSPRAVVTIEMYDNGFIGSACINVLAKNQACKNILIVTRKILKDIAESAPDTGKFLGLDPQKFKQTSTYRSATIARIWYYQSLNHFLELIEMSKETYRTIGQIAFRANPRKGYGDNEHVPRLIEIYRDDPELFQDVITSDLLKYRQSLCVYIINKLYDDIVQNCSEFIPAASTRERYDYIIQNCPEFVKKNKYNIKQDPFVSMNVMQRLYRVLQPTDRMGWYLMAMLVHKYFLHKDEETGMYIDGRHEEGFKIKFSSLTEYESVKIVRAGNKLWYEYRKRNPTVRNFGFKDANIILMVIIDGKTLYKNIMHSEPDAGPMKVEGSAVRMYRAAMYNHDIERKLNLDRIMRKPLVVFDPPRIALPPWVEQIRLKNSHELIIAGTECNHCIGSYAQNVQPDDLFIREDTVCAHISLSSFTVMQCYDQSNSVTKKSDDLRKRLTSWLALVEKGK